MRQKFLPQIKKGAFLDLRHFFLMCGVFFFFFLNAAELVFSFFYPPICGGNRRECGGNRRECGGNSRKANGVAAFLFWLRRFFWFAADFLECGGNFRRNALRQKFPPQEVLGIVPHGQFQAAWPVADGLCRDQDSTPGDQNEDPNPSCEVTSLFRDPVPGGFLKSSIHVFTFRETPPPPPNGKLNKRGAPLDALVGG